MSLWSIYQFQTRESLKLSNTVGYLLGAGVGALEVLLLLRQYEQTVLHVVHPNAAEKVMVEVNDVLLLQVV